MTKPEGTQRVTTRSDEQEKPRYEAPRLEKEQNLKKIAKEFTFSVTIP
jgi:hypothetical protein